MNEGKPFVKWVGGKTQLLPQIEPHLPENFNRTTYVEPFIGGGAMLFFMLQKFPQIERVVINDINPDLINAYRTIKGTPEELIGKLDKLQSKYIPLDDSKRKELYLDIRSKFNAGRLKPIDRATYFIFLLKTCFNGLWRVNSKGLMNTPSGRYTNPNICDRETIMRDSELLQRVEILNGDFAQTLEYATPESFFYIDSPYKPLTASASFTSYSEGGFDDNEQLRLKEFCDNISQRGALFIESNSDVRQVNDNTFFDDLYNEYNIHRVFAKRAINSKGDGRGEITEILIKNY